MITRESHSPGECEKPKCREHITHCTSAMKDAVTWLYFTCLAHVEWAQQQLTSKGAT